MSRGALAADTSGIAVELVDVAPRDGLQNEAVMVPTEVKAALVMRLLEAGIRRVEVTAFVSPRAVPQMADAEELMAGLLGSSHRPGSSLIGLVVNQRGVERALSAGVDEINVVIVTTDSYNRANQGVPTVETAARLPELVAAAHEAGCKATITVAAAFGCPYEGEVPIRRLTEVVRAALRARPDEIALADSIGVAVPSDVTERIAAVRAVLREVAAEPPDSRLLPALRCHFHDTRNTGVANALAAVVAGVDALDSSLGGIGGCPFAPAATGNVATEDVLYALERSHVHTGVSLASVLESSRWLGGRLGHALPALVSKAGPFPASGARCFPPPDAPLQTVGDAG